MVDGTQIKFLPEHPLDTGTHARAVPVPRQVHHRSNEPVEPVGTQE